MTPETFFELMLQDRENNQELGKYYKFLADDKNFQFRKNHFLGRLHYIYDNLIQQYKTDEKIWDCGCGYGTTGLFLAMNGISSHGTTLEFYYDTIEKRLKYWQQYGDTSLFTYSYENLFDPDSLLNGQQFHWILVQDTLHHLEPINQALSILHQRLTDTGKLLILEENGNNILQNAILYRRRGNKKIIDIWDEKLNKYITIGNENIRSLKHWDKLFQKNNLSIDQSSIKYSRYFLPFYYKFTNTSNILDKENHIQTSSHLRKEFLFFGLNFIARKSKTA